MIAPRLSLVIPCYNEQGNLPRLVERCRQVFVGKGVEVVLVNNGSTDSTASLLSELIGDCEFIRSVRVDVNQGYGFGVLSGLRAARGEFLAWTHADLQTDPADVMRGIALIEGARVPQRAFVKGKRHGRRLGDLVFTWGMAVLETMLLGYALWDINAQPNVFHRSFFDAWVDPPHDFSLDLYVYVTALRSGLEIRRFPVYFSPRLEGQGHNDQLAAKLRYTRRTLSFSLNLRRRLRSTAERG